MQDAAFSDSGISAELSAMQQHRSHWKAERDPALLFPSLSAIPLSAAGTVKVHRTVFKWLAERYFNALATSDYDYLQECIPEDATLTDAYDRYKELADTGYFYTYDTDHLKITKYNIKSDEIQMKVTCSCDEGHPGSMYRSKAELNIIAYQKDGIYYIDQNQSDNYITTKNLIPISDY